jgi:Rrf2 family protein
LELSTKAEYGVRAAIDLAQCSEEQTTFHAIADRQGIPPKFMPQIMRDLSKAGLVVTTRGFRGGVKLARSSAEISLRALVEAIEGPLAIYRCLASASVCPRAPHCSLRPVWMRAQEALLQVFERTPLSELARNGKPTRGRRS